MMLRSRWASLLATLIVGPALGVDTARADVPPPADYIEKCTLENAKRDGEECISRPNEWAFDWSARSYLATFGFCRRCRTYGATYAEVVYCRTKDGASPLPSDFDAQLEARSQTSKRERPPAADSSTPAGPPLGIKDCLMDAPKATSPGTRPDRGRPPSPSKGCSCSWPSAPSARGGCLVGAAILSALLMRRARATTTSGAAPSRRRRKDGRDDRDPQ